MIESNIIKRYIVKSFMQTSRTEIGTVAERILGSLSTKFLLNENVVIPASSQFGKVIRCSKDTYKILTLENTEIDIPFEEINRKYKLTHEDIFMFLECVTKQTTFGRILIENVFEKISVPGFGTKKMTPEESKRTERIAAQKSMQHRQIKETAIDRNTESLPAKKETSRSKYPKLNLLNLPLLTVNQFEDERLRGLVKIFMFMCSFKEIFPYDHTEININTISEAILDPEYSTPLILEIHSTLIEIIESEIKAKRERFFEIIEFIVEKLPSFESANPVLALKKRIQMNHENWKIQLKLFISNITKELENDRIQRFSGIFKKDQIDLRIEFLIFLIDIVTLTDIFKEHVTDKQNLLKSEKAKHEQYNMLKKKRRDDAEEAEMVKLSEELVGYDDRVFNHPLKIHLGKYKDYMLFVMDRKILLKYNNTFYILGMNDVVSIIRDLNLHIKSEKNTALNLKAGIEVLYK